MKSTLNADELQTLATYLSESATGIHAALELCREAINGNPSEASPLVAIQATLEKSGFLVDLGSSLIGDIVVCGDFGGWLALSELSPLTAARPASARND